MYSAEYVDSGLEHLIVRRTSAEEKQSISKADFLLRNSSEHVDTEFRKERDNFHDG